MRTLIKEVIYQPAKIKEGLYASPASFRLEMRNFMKQEMRDKYFKKNKEFVPAKNLGCYLFGQKDTWKGIVSIQYQIIDKANNKSHIQIFIDRCRINNNILPEIVKILENLLNNMIKETNFTEEIKSY